MPALTLATAADRQQSADSAAASAVVHPENLASLLTTVAAAAPDAASGCFLLTKPVTLIVAAGVICTPRMNPRFLDEYQNDHSELFLSLTSREREILVLLGENKSNQEMADELYLSVSTVKTHLRSIFRKLGLRSRREAQIILKEMGYNDKNGKRLKMNKNIDAAAKLHIIK